jgi:hypothetical protein
MILPHLRKAGAYEEVCDKFDFWEIDRRISESPDLSGAKGRLAEQSKGCPASRPRARTVSREHRDRRVGGMT